MENIMYTKENQRKIEGFVLVIYSIYSACMVTMFIRQDTPVAASLILTAGVMAGWLLHVIKRGSYIMRAQSTAVLIQLSVIVYTVVSNEFVRVLPLFGGLVAVLGLYGLPAVISGAFISITIIFGYYGIVSGVLTGGTFEEIMRYILQLCNMYLMEYVMYVWTKCNNEGSSRLLNAIAELKEAERSKNDFLANISHEIRTPINSICGMSEIILRQSLPDKVMERVQDIQLAGRYLSTVVSDILDFSELQSDRIELEEEAYNITSTINDIVNMVTARKAEKQLELIVDCEAGIPSILFGDEKKLRRIIVNLADNAIKFTDKGCVVIRIGYRRQEDGINLTVAVKDTGIGMDEESVNKLFTCFNQVDAGRSRHEGGVGLGLAIANALVQKMGGIITVTSKPEEGSCFRCCLPQKVVDGTPIVSIQNTDRIDAAIYISMGQFALEAVRTEYSRHIEHMVKQLKGRYLVCQNLQQLQKRQCEKPFTHIFISMKEYEEEKEFYDQTAETTKVIVLLDRRDEKYMTNARIRKIYKPFYILAAASVLNEAEDELKDIPAAAAEKFVTTGVHVLAVDDNRTNLRVIQGLLTHYRINVTTAAGGEEALERITSEDYDFVFMDHMMPDMDGVEALHRIRQMDGNYYKKVPIIALTANAVAGTREMLMAEGFDDFLEKPVERSVLERVLKRTLPSRKIITVQDYRNTAEESGRFQIEGLDVHKGMLYCGGREAYLKVLRGYCEDGNDMALTAGGQFEQRDWKNYTVTVHGMKSAMHSIGALELAAYAGKIELAAKEERIDYILEHHAELMREYQSLFMQLRGNRLLFPDGFDEKALSDKENEEKQPQLSALEEEEFDKILLQLDEATYELDEDRLLQLTSELERYQYCQVPVSEVIQTAKRKIKMSDYVSAVELIKRWKSKAEEES